MLVRSKCAPVSDKGCNEYFLNAILSQASILVTSYQIPFNPVKVQSPMAFKRSRLPWKWSASAVRPSLGYISLTRLLFNLDVDCCHCQQASANYSPEVSSIAC